MSEREIITRAEAKARGLKRYYTGRPCTKGHVAERQVSSKACLECQRERQREYYQQNAERRREYHREYYRQNAERLREYFREHYKRRTSAGRCQDCGSPAADGKTRCEECLERCREYNREYRQQNAERRREYFREYQRDNRAQFNAYDARRRARLRATTPADQSKEEREAIDEVYFEARLCAELLGEPCEVDHIRPLAKGGLHIYSNLQVLTEREHRRKGTRLDWKPSEGVFIE